MEKSDGFGGWGVYRDLSVPFVSGYDFSNVKERMGGSQNYIAAAAAAEFNDLDKTYT